MQPSALWRRGVVVPLTAEAERAIERWDVDRTTAVRFLAIDDAGQFERLWEYGVFRVINRACASIIDDYEEERLSCAVLPKAIAAVSDLGITEPDVRTWTFQLRELLREAIDLERSVFFVL